MVESANSDTGLYYFGSLNRLMRIVILNLFVVL
jgi:hypothetical protein